jgi:formylglycine-generating enzyme required for sulfatase activity
MDWVTVPAQTRSLGISAEAARAWVLANASLGLTPERLLDEQPEHTVQIASFEIARAPLTCAAYQRFVDAGGYRDLELFQELVTDAGTFDRDGLASFVDRTGRPGPSTWTDGRAAAGHDTHPVDGISYYEAAACARFFSARLPSEAEWECAARAPDGRHFPWGNDLPHKLVANFKWNHVGGTSPVGQFEAGQSGLGLQDVAGNVHEWTASAYRAYPKGRTRLRFAGTSRAQVARGGAFNGELWDLRTTSRFGVEPQLRFPGLGMRLAR